MTQSIFLDPRRNAIRKSSICQFEGSVAFNAFAVKMVLTGEETYFIGNKRFTVSAGEYIVGNSSTFADIKINSLQKVDGLCVDVSEEILREVVHFHTENPDELCEFLLSDQLLVNTYKARNTSLGYALNEIHQSISQGLNREVIRTELFYSIAESVIRDQCAVFDQLKKLNFKRTETNEDLTRAMLFSLEYLNDHYLEEINLDTIATEVGISKYHFIRLFKKSFNSTPYQYLLQRRLRKSYELLSIGQSPGEVAVNMGFADASSFSKAFKKQFGYPPSSMDFK